MVNVAMRWSGLALLTGVLLLGAAVAIVSLRRQGLASPALDTMLLVGSILLMLGWTGMYARQAEAAGWLGLVGHILLQAGSVLIIVATAQPLFTPSITGLGESATAFFLGVALLLGLVLTAVATLRAGVYPRWSGVLLLAAGAGFLFSCFVAEDLPPIAGPLDGAIFGLFIAGAFGWIGVSLWMGQDRIGSSQPAA
jgi:hypothetical protein